jgi:prolyl oligopeptidase
MRKSLSGKARAATLATIFLAGSLAPGISGISRADDSTPASVEDPYIWLEEVEGKAALEWVADQNALSLPRLEGDPRYEPLRDQAEAIYTSQDRIPYGSLRNGWVYNFWQDEAHVRGILRRARLDSYKSDTPDWQTVLDVDAIAKAEDENWVYKGHACMAPEFTRCMIDLSRGGKDAVVKREYNLDEGKFVEGGFTLAEAKGSVGWIDEDTLLVSSNFGEGTLTESGYPRTARVWNRGTDIADAPTVFEIPGEEMGVFVDNIARPEGSQAVIFRVPQFFTGEVLIHRGGENFSVPFPMDADFQGLIAGKALALMRSEWSPAEGISFAAGSLVAIDLEASLAAGKPVNPTAVAQPTTRRSIDSVSIGRKNVLINFLDDVKGQLVEATLGDGGWVMAPVKMPENGSIRITDYDAFSGVAMINFNSFLIPTNLYAMEEGGTPEPVKSLPERFDASGYVSEQHFATSADGTRIPYFILHARDMAHDGSSPTLVGGYGGFEVSRKPYYASALTIGWLQAGGVYVLANIRGGGEYGPAWHQSALLENRQRAYDDFIAVAEDLIAHGVTSPAHLGIRGGSNGGLLVGAVTMQRPELYSAVICAVPLLDMLRYHKLLAGASWMAEYGNPDIPEQRAFIEKYSPYQNIDPDKKYPEIFFWTNTKDDRVHPGHARKMVARMKEQGHEVLYFENTEGGHGGGANQIQRARTTALQQVYLLQKLKD